MKAEEYYDNNLSEYPRLNNLDPITAKEVMRMMDAFTEQLQHENNRLCETQTFGEMVGKFPELKDICEPHEWDNRTIGENYQWILSKIQQLQQENIDLWNRLRAAEPTNNDYWEMKYNDLKEELIEFKYALLMCSPNPNLDGETFAKLANLQIDIREEMKELQKQDFKLPKLKAEENKCNHNWVDATNEVISGTKYCSRCGKLERPN